MHDLLPRLAVDLTKPAPAHLASLFVAPVRDVWLEIGFGGGEHLLWQATHNPDVGIIGCEPFEEGVVKALAAIEDGGLANVRIHPDDARELLRWLPDACLRRAFILFPDPWPKKKHVKRRLINSALLDALARVLKPGAELRVATDIGDYARTILLAALAHPAFIWTAKRPSDWRVRAKTGRPHDTSRRQSARAAAVIFSSLQDVSTMLRCNPPMRWPCCRHIGQKGLASGVIIQ